jgi:galactosamine-6-phosphate isomerase
MNSRENKTAWRVRVAENPEAMGRWACEFMVGELERRPNLLLCASAGATPTRAYELLAEERGRRPALFERMRVLKIDEWGGLAMDDPGTCEVYLRRYLVGPLGIGPERYQGFDSRASDFQAECGRMTRWVASQGPIDVCVLGLGVNGHVALNEPGDELRPHAHPARLAAESLAHPMLEASGGRPSRGLTLGMAEILRSRRILVLVSGSRKREPLQRLLEPVISTRFPGSFLWLHPDVTLICDREASAG